MASKKKGSPSRFWSKLVYFLVFGAVGVLLYQDVQQGEKSLVRRQLNNTGALEYASKATQHCRAGLTWVHLRLDEQLPGYYEKTSAYLDPYVTLFKELGVILYNVVVNIKNAAVEKYPVIVSAIESYAPGALEQIRNIIVSTWNVLVKYFNLTVEYLRNDVFVGQLAPENLKRLLFEAVTTTQVKAAECYRWVYEKVQATLG